MLFLSVMCFFLFFSLETWCAVYRNSAGWHASWHRLRHEVSVRHGLRSPRPGSSKHSGQQQSSVQSVRLWLVQSAGGWPRGCLHHQGKLEVLTQVKSLCQEQHEWMYWAKSTGHTASFTAALNSGYNILCSHVWSCHQQNIFFTLTSCSIPYKT